VTVVSTAAEKITLFRRLFAGRSEVFPVRWENRNTGKSGYAPACANEWIRGVCGKPQVKCGECPNQAFIPLSDNVIASHLRGTDPGRSGTADFVAGVYAVRVDETCRFLAVDFDGNDWSADALDGKREVIVYDYVDRGAPVLARMAAKREKGYKTLGYVFES